MKMNDLKLAAAAIFAAAALTACGGSSMTATTSNTASQPEAPGAIETETMPAEAPKGRFDDVPDLEDGPHLFISETTAKPGDIAEVTISVENANLKWNMCGLHIVYPDVLECQMFNEEDRLVKVKKGEAVDYATGSVCMLWRDNLTDEMKEKKQKSVFFTAVLDNNNGQDGAIATYFFKVPEDAVSGTVYPIDYYYQDTDIFSNQEKDPAFEKYAFKNWTGGSITVE